METGATSKTASRLAAAMSKNYGGQRGWAQERGKRDRETGE